MFVFCYSEKKNPNELGLFRNPIEFLKITYFQRNFCSFLLVFHESLIKLNFKADTSSFSEKTPL